MLKLESQPFFLSLEALEAASSRFDQALSEVVRLRGLIDAEGNWRHGRLGNRGRKWARETPTYEMIDRHLATLEADSRMWSLLARRAFCLLRDRVDGTMTRGREDDLEKLLIGCGRLPRLEDSVATYKDLIVQRATLDQAPDWLHTSLHLDELQQLQDVYCAIDGAILGYYLAIFGQRWIQDQESFRRPWLPICRVGGGAYRIRLSIAPVTEIPRTDLLTSRRWPLLAHELAHAKIAVLFRKGGILWAATKPGGDQGRRQWLGDVIDRWRDAISALGMTPTVDSLLTLSADWNRWVYAVASVLGDGCGEHPLDREIGYAALAQAQEILADAIALRVAGPAYLCAFGAFVIFDISRLEGQSGQDERQQLLEVLTWRHPPSAVRVLLMLQLLDRWGLGEARERFGVHEYVEWVRRGSHRYRGLERAIQVWEESIEGLAPGLNSLTDKLIGGNEWRCDVAHIGQVSECLRNRGGMGSPYGPGVVLNTGWLKHLEICDIGQTVGGAVALDTAQPLPTLFPWVVGLLGKYLREVAPVLIASGGITDGE